MDILFLPPQTASDADRERVLAFWAGEQALPEDVARRRARQVVALAEENGQICGVATGFVNLVPRLGQPLFLYRTYVAQARRQQGIAHTLLEETFSSLQSYFMAQDLPAALGVFLQIPDAVAITLNQHREWPKSHFTWIGRDPQGHHLRVRYFDKARLREAQA